MQECTTYFSARQTIVYVYCLATDVTKLKHLYHCITNRLTTTMPVICNCTFLFLTELHLFYGSTNELLFWPLSIIPESYDQMKASRELRKACSSRILTVWQSRVYKYPTKQFKTDFIGSNKIIFKDCIVQTLLFSFFDKG